MTKSYFYTFAFVGILAALLGGTYLYQTRYIGDKIDTTKNTNGQVYGTKK